MCLFRVARLHPMEESLTQTKGPFTGSKSSRKIGRNRFVHLVAGSLVLVCLLCPDRPLSPAGFDCFEPGHDATVAADPAASFKDEVQAKPGAKTDYPVGDRQPGGHIDRFIASSADRHRVEPALIKAIIRVESGFQNDAVSDKGAGGLMQLMPQTARSLGLTDILDPAENIDAGTRYLRELMDRFDGDLRLALAAYNAGIGRVARFGGVPPFETTHAFIRRVLHYHQLYQNDV